MRQDLSVARAGFTAVQDQLRSGDADAARGRLKVASAASRSAGDTVDGLPFRVYGWLPGTRGPVTELRTLARSVDTVGTEILPALLETDLRLPTWTGRIELDRFERAQRPLERAEARLSAVQVELSGIEPSGVRQLTTARQQLVEAVGKLGGTVREARVAADVVPALGGGTRPQRFFLALQNNAEARGTGGLLGAYGVLLVDKGRLRLEQVAQNDKLTDPAKPVLQLGPEYDQRYSRFESTRTWRSANLSPDVPTVGPLLAALWEGQSRTPVDGVILMDPVALADLLRATGPVTLSDGTSITGDNAVQVLEADVYRRYANANDKRYAFLAETAEKAFATLSQRSLDGRSLIRQFAQSVSTGHLQMWAADPEVQRDLLRSRASGRLAANGPFLSVVTNDAGGSKLDYYQHRTVTYEGKSTGVAVDLGNRPELEEEAVVTVRLENRAPKGLPSYVLLRPDDPKAPAGQSHTWVSVYLGARSTLLDATINGERVELESDTEQGLSVFSTFVKINSGDAATLRLRVRQPATPDQPLLYRQQPLVRDDDVTVRREGSPQPVVYAYSRERS